MIRAAVITDEITQDFERALDVMLEYGVRDAELRGLWGTNVMDLSPEQMERAKNALAERGMQACGIASPLYKCHLFPRAGAASDGPLHLAQERTLEDQPALLERAIELARYFNTNLIRIFAFWKVEGPVTDEVLERIVATMRPGVARAEEAGVTLGLENEHACILGTGAEAARALQAINSPALRGIWDPGNAFMAGETPFPDGYSAMKPYLAHIHVKDADCAVDGGKGWVVVGEGDLKYREQIQALVADGYQGLLSLETHYQTPSGDTEEASRLCLERLVGLINEAGASAG